MTHPELVSTQDGFNPESIGPEKYAGLLLFTPEEAHLVEQAVQDPEVQTSGLLIKRLDDDDTQINFEQAEAWQKFISQREVERDYYDFLSDAGEGIQLVKEIVERVARDNIALHKKRGEGFTVAIQYVANRDEWQIDAFWNAYDRLAANLVPQP